MEKINNQEEIQLIERARSGDIEAFSALVESCQERAIHAANALVGNLEDARDLAQEAFVKAYENLDSFKSESRFYTWVYRILANTCKDFLRKRKLRRTLSFWFSSQEQHDDASQRVKDDAPDARQNLQVKEFGQAVQAALEKIPQQQRTVFVLRYVEGLMLEEIAETLNISTGAVKANLWQAGNKMKVLLKDYLRESTE